MNLRNHEKWSEQHESRLQTLLEYAFLLQEMRSTEPTEAGSWDAGDPLKSKRSAEEVLDALMQVIPTERSLATAAAMHSQH